MGKICDMVMKGPPKWFVRMIVALVILALGIQIGLYRERSSQTAQAVRAELDKKDAQLDRLKIALNDALFDLAVEREKFEIVLCESGLKHEGIWGDGGRSYGIAQFQYATFRDLRGQAGRPDLRWKNRDDQLWLLDWALRHGYGRYWTCYKSSRELGVRSQEKSNGDAVALVQGGKQ